MLCSTSKISLDSRTQSIFEHSSDIIHSNMYGICFRGDFPCCLVWFRLNKSDPPRSFFFLVEIHNNWYGENRKLVSNVLVDAGQLLSSLSTVEVEPYIAREPSSGVTKQMISQIRWSNLLGAEGFSKFKTYKNVAGKGCSDRSDLNA